MTVLAAAGALFAALALCGALCPGAAHAADAVDAANGKAGYTYTVRVFAGNQGTVDGGECKVYEGIPAGSRWSFHPEMVRVADNSKYYVKGIKLAGRDNDTALAVANTSSFIVDEDVDLVVAYGMRGSVTYYTVTYVDESGRELAPAQRYEGNVGDRPVVAYRYIEGYRPQAYNLSGTLSEDESRNAFQFVYTPVAAGEGAGGAAGAAGAASAAGAAGATDAGAGAA
ncbi:MucBP domain-containing protein, partial [Adlercreutzia sp. ZJ305]